MCECDWFSMLSTARRERGYAGSLAAQRKLKNLELQADVGKWAIIKALFCRGSASSGCLISAAGVMAYPLYSAECSQLVIYVFRGI